MREEGKEGKKKERKRVRDGKMRKESIGRKRGVKGRNKNKRKEGNEGDKK